MKNNLIKKYTVGIFLLFAFVGGGVYFVKRSIPKETNPKGMEMMYVADFSDDRNVLGFASNVFSAKINKVIEHTEVQGIPVTFYEAEVIYNIKGDLEGNIKLMQFVGYRGTGENKKLSSFGEETQLLEPGKTYLLATKHEEQYDCYGIGPHPNQSKLLSNDSNLSFSALKELSKNDEKTLKWEEAYKNEILFEPDLK